MNSLLAIFDQIWLTTVYHSTGYFVQIGATLKIHKNRILIGIRKTFYAAQEYA